MEITAIVVAVISLLGQVVLLLLQRKQAQAKTKKDENEASGILIDKALNINKQETENLRILLDVIKNEYKECLTSNELKDKKIENLMCENNILTRKLNRVCDMLREKGVDTKVCDEHSEE